MFSLSIEVLFQNPEQSSEWNEFSRPHLQTFANLCNGIHQAPWQLMGDDGGFHTGLVNGGVVQLPNVDLGTDEASADWLDRV